MLSTRRTTMLVIFAITFLVTMAIAIPTYVQSSFIEQYVGVDYVGLVLAVASVAALLAMLTYPFIITRLGNFRTLLLTVLVALFCLTFLLHASTLAMLLIYFIVQYVCFVLFRINLDVFLETVSDDEHTGQIRALYLTISNVAWVVAPFIMGKLIEHFSLSVPYMISAFLLIPVALFLIIEKHILEKPALYKPVAFSALWQQLRADANIKRVLLIRLTLSIFFAVMVLYVPIYLTKNIGMSWNELGLVFTIMLLPYLFLTFPAGTLADKFFGEKEMTFLGFLIMILSVIAITITQTDQLLVWIVILFASRMGAALVEIMAETYFFKKIDARDLGIINAFRLLQPLGYLITTAFAFVALIFLPITSLFITLTIVLALALIPTLKLADTK